MNLTVELQTITAEEISAAYRASGLHRERIGLARALENPTIYRALRITALTRRKQQHGQPAPTQRGTGREKAA